MPEVTNAKYYAFISYSHSDDKWGAWLHKGLESYHPPKSIIGKSNRDGVVPKTLAPIFQDIHELPTASDLGAMIKDALEQSRYLIVICSPASAKSIWVNEEILTFKRLGKANRILAIIVDGEPNATTIPGQEHLECFPPALRFNLDDEGNLSDQPAEPIAADARDNKGGKKNALLKLIAGVLGVNFDDLVQREKKRQQKRRLAMLLTACIAVIAAIVVWFTLQQEQQKAFQAKVDKLTTEAVEALDSGDLRTAMTKLSAALPSNLTETDTPVLKRTLAVLNRANFLQKQLSSISVDTSIVKMQVLNNGNLLTQNQKGNVLLYDANSKLIHEFAGVTKTSPLLSANYHINNAQTLLTLSVINNEPVKVKDDIRYLDVFRSRTYQLNNAKIISSVTKQVIDIPNGLISTYGAGRDKYYLNDGHYYLALHETYLGEEPTETQLLSVNTKTGEYKVSARINAKLSSLIYVEGVGVIADTRPNSTEKKNVGGLFILREGSDTFIELLPRNTVKACNAGKPAKESELTGKTIKSPRYSVTKDKKHLVLLVTDIAGYASHCMQSWELSDLNPSSLIALDSFYELTGNERKIAERVIDLDPPLYRLHERRLKSLTNNKVHTQSADSNSYASADPYESILSISVKTSKDYVLKGHAAKITSLAFNDKNGVLYSAGEDLAIKSWAIQSGAQITDNNLNYLNGIQVAELSVLSQQSEYDDQQKKQRFSYVISPINVSSDNTAFSKSTSIDFLLGEKKQLEAKLLVRGKRLGIVVNKNLGFRIVKKGEASSQKPLPKNTYHLYDTENGSNIATIQHDLFVYQYPVIIHDLAYFPIDGKFMSLNLNDGTTQSTNLADGYTVNEVLKHGNKLLLIADNDQDDDPDKRIQRFYLVEPKASATPRLIAEYKAQAIEIVQDVQQQRTLLKVDVSYKENILSLIDTAGNERRLKLEHDDVYGTNYILSTNKDIIYLINDNKSVAAFNYEGTPLAVTYSTQRWYQPRLFHDEQYVIDDDSLLSISDKPVCDKVDKINGYIAVSNNEQFIAIANETTKIYDLNVCEIVREFSVNPSSDSMAISDDGHFSYAYEGELIQQPVKQSISDNIMQLLRWRAQNPAQP